MQEGLRRASARAAGSNPGALRLEDFDVEPATLDRVNSLRLALALQLQNSQPPAAVVPLDSTRLFARSWLETTQFEKAPFTLTLCAIMKAESRRLNEFVVRNFQFGFQHFVIYHDVSGSYDARQRALFEEMLRPLSESGLATVIEFRGSQGSAITHCYRDAGSTSAFVSFLDSDEYFTWRYRPADVPQYFRTRYMQPGIGGVAATWVLFGSNGNVYHPGGSYTSRYPRLCRPDRHIKAIVRPAHVSHWQNPHFGAYAPGYSVVRQSDLGSISGPWSLPDPDDPFFVAHYHAQSLEGYLFKRLTNGGLPKSQYTLPFWLAHTNNCLDLPCPHAKRISPEVNRLLASMRTPYVKLEWEPILDDVPVFVFLGQMLKLRRSWSLDAYVDHLSRTRQVHWRDAADSELLHYLTMLAAPNSTLLGDTSFWRPPLSPPLPVDLPAATAVATAAAATATAAAVAGARSLPFDLLPAGTNAGLPVEVRAAHVSGERGWLTVDVFGLGFAAMWLPGHDRVFAWRLSSPDAAHARSLAWPEADLVSTLRGEDEQWLVLGTLHGPT